MANLEAIKKQLEDRLRELTDETQEIGSELRKPLDADADERAIELEDDEVLEELGNTAIEESEEIRKALRRIDSGTYGICTSCGDKISEARLKAVPHAENCINCAT